MKVTITENGIEREIDAKNILVKGITLEILVDKVNKLEKNYTDIETKYKNREAKLIKLWRKTRGVSNE